MEMNTQEVKKDYRPLGGVSGLGGWLVLVQIVLYLNLILLVFQLLQYNLPSFSPDVWGVLTSKDSESYHPLWGPVIVFEAVANALMFFYCILLLVFFYNKKAILPRMMIIFYAAGLFVSIMDYVLALQIPAIREMEDGSSLQDLSRSIVSTAIWIPYFLRSKRVHNTFVN